MTIPSSSVVSDLQWEHAVHSPPSSPITSTSSSDYEQPFPVHQHSRAKPDNVEASGSIIDSIYDTVQGFPQQTLFLNTPCVVDIRHQNHFAQCATDPQRFSNPSSSSLNYSHFEQLQPSSRRRRTATNFFAPLLRTTTRKSSLSRNEVTPSYETQPSSSRSSVSRSLAPQSDTSPPELSAFRHIFPDTQDWWRNVL